MLIAALIIVHVATASGTSCLDATNKIDLAAEALTAKGLGAADGTVNVCTPNLDGSYTVTFTWSK